MNLTTKQAAERHIHTLIRLDLNGLPTHGFRYECKVCGARLRRKNGVMAQVSLGSLLASHRWATTEPTEAHSEAARRNGVAGGRPMLCGGCGICVACDRKAKRLLLARISK